MTIRVNNSVTEMRNYNYGNENRPLSVTDALNGDALVTEYGYDGAGNRIQKLAYGTVPPRTTLYGYDERNLVTSMADPIAGACLYTYNGDAQRVGKMVNGTLTTLLIDALRPVYEVVRERQGSTITASYTFGASRLATWNGTAVTFELADRLGSVRIVTDASGSVIHGFNYDVFGANR
jgi:YD repeat-containing protein